MNQDKWNEYLQRSRKWNIRISYELLHSAAFRELEYSAALKVLIWFYEKVRYEVIRGKKGKDRYLIVDNGEMIFTYGEAKIRGLDHRKFARALKELCHYGFIDLKKQGSGDQKDCSIFTLSERYKDYGTDRFIAKEMPSAEAAGFRKTRKCKIDCKLCMHREPIGNDGWARCSHPHIIEVQEQSGERKPGLAVARALRAMQKTVCIGINPAAYRLHWFNWPWYFNSIYVDACKGFKKKTTAQM